MSEQIQEFIRHWIGKHKSKFDQLYNLTELELEGLNFYPFEFSTYEDNVIDDESSKIDQEVVKALIKYQYNVDDSFLSTLKNIKVEKSKSDRIKEFYVDQERFATIRSSDSLIIPSEAMAKFLHNSFEFPRQRVVIQSDVKGFIKEGKSVFSKFVTQVDLSLRPGDECIIVTEQDELIGFGQLQITFQEAQHFTRGIMVKTRKGL